MVMAFCIVICLDGWSNERMQDTVLRSKGGAIPGVCIPAGTYVQLSQKGSF